VSGRAGATIPALAEVAERATASGSPAATVLAECAAWGGAVDGSVRETTRALEALEGVFRLHDELLGTRPGSQLNGGRDPIAVGIGGAWQLARASEAASRFEEAAAAMWAKAANRLARARILRFGDLYDAGRTPSRWLATAEMGSGSLFALAARLGASLAAPDEPVEAAFGDYGRELGVAVEIRADVAGLRDPDGPVARRIGAGDYPLPLLYAIESAPELAGRLGKPLDGEALGAVLEAITGAGGEGRAIDECRRRALASATALDGLPGVDALLDLAHRVTHDPREGPR
jgi:geranylgeranyl pyrophosphate synthase